MKRISLLVTFFLCTFGTLSAQSLDSGIQLYRDGDYERALLVFEQSDEPTAKLFAGKSHFALGNYFKAKQVLNTVNRNNQDVYLETLYTLALTDFQLKNFAGTLDQLYELTNNFNRSSITSDAVSFYTQTLNYLSLEQRFDAFRASVYDEVRLDLLEAAVGNVEYGAARSMYNAYREALPENAMTRDRLSSIGSSLSDSVSYTQRYNFSYPEAPEGISYNIGVVLPQFDENSEEYEITQNLYFGIQLAVDRFNGEHPGRKVFLHFQNTKSDPSAAASIANELIWNKYTDAIIGPLFSEVAMKFSDYAEMYEVPLLLPLANSDSINFDLNYTFQFNPTFAVQGRKMAEFAYRDLGYDTVAVIAESNSLGEPSAEAFYEEFSRLGGNVVKYDIRDLESKGYDIREYTSYLNPELDTTFNVHVDAIYAPFTGVVASTLISSLLTEIEAAGSNITVLGSEEWAASDLSALGLEGNRVYFSRGFNVSSQNMDKDEFDSEFRLRFDITPNRFAYIGYDVANALLNTLNRVQNPAYLKQGLKSIRNYQGFAMNINFDERHINQAVQIERLQVEN